MKRYYSLLIAIVSFTLCAGISRAQLVGDNIFLGGHFLQGCVSPNGSLGSTLDYPVGYYGNSVSFTSDPITCATAVGNNLASVFDYGRNGWTVPAGRPFDGDYTLPGSPWEGWAIQIGTGTPGVGVQDNAWYTDLFCGGYFSSTGVVSLTGLIGNYSNNRGSCGIQQDAMTGTWKGNYNGIKINMETRIDTQTSWMVFTVKLTNTTGVAINNIYYMRSCDPDNDEAIGGGFPTNNTIVYNEPLAGTGNRVEVKALGQTYADAYLCLATVDCRAHCFIAESWPDFSGYTIDQYWASVAAGAGNTYAPGGTDNGDYAIGLAYQVGTLAAGDSTVLCYTYGYKDPGVNIDSPFTKPFLAVNCTAPPTTGGLPSSNDTIDMCTYTGGFSATVNILNVDEFWANASYTWSPSIGLSTTSGTSSTINIAALTNTYTTYTIIGNAHLPSCINLFDTFYVTIKLCTGIVANQPCFGDTLKLQVINPAPTNTFLWTGPAGFTSTVVNPVIPNVTFADSGLYTCVRDSGTIPIDTYYTHVYIRPLPIVTASSNAPLCEFAGNVLDLYSTRDSSIETYSWTGPNGFTSVLQNPAITTFSILDTGAYKVVTQMNGCFDSGSVYIRMCIQGTVNSPCFGDTLKFQVIGGTGGDTYLWTGPGGFTSTLANPVIPNATFADSGLYTLVGYYGGATLDTVYIHAYVKPLPVVTASSNGPLCASSTDVLDLYATSISPLETFSWSGPVGYTSVAQNPIDPTFTIADTGTYKVITQLNGCFDSATTYVGVTPVPVFSVINNGPLCAGSTLVITAIDTFTLYTYYSWSGPGGTSGTGTSNIVLNITNVPASDSGVYTINLTVGSCPALAVLDTVVIHATPIPPAPQNVSYCQYLPADTLIATGVPGATINWFVPPYYNVNFFASPTPPTNIAGTITYLVSETVGFCTSAQVPLLVTINPKPAPPLPIHYGYCLNAIVTDTLSVNLGSLVTDASLTWYGPGIPPVGTHHAPPILTGIVGLDSFYITQTSQYGCISDRILDTLRIVPIPVPPTITSAIYCQYDFAANGYNAPSPIATGNQGSTITWYYPTPTSAGTPTTPVPTTATIGNQYYWATQTLMNDSVICTSPQSWDTITIYQKPEPFIIADRAFVCQYDTMSLTCIAGNLNQPNYIWIKPQGDTFYTGSVGSGATDYNVTIRFDSLFEDTVKIIVSDYMGYCRTDTNLVVKIIPAPSSTGYIQPDACLGDTVLVALSERSFNAINFTWTVDNQPFYGNGIDSVVASNSNGGGPFSLYFLQSGYHVINITPYSPEGCVGLPAEDTIRVHDLPVSAILAPGSNYSFTTVCIGDSLRFSCADTTHFNYSYVWTPDQCFNNPNSPIAWGVIRMLTPGSIYLQVTDPWGCTSTSSYGIDPHPCCDTVWFPNAFVPDPNSDCDNCKFGPLFIQKSNHQFHEFRITNRWGQTVFETTTTGQRWDGTLNGVPQDIGVYYYFIKYDCNGGTKVQSGDITLIR